MTPARARVLAALTSFIETHGHSPTRLELAAAMGAPESTVRSHLERLERDGRVRWVRGSRQSIEPIGLDGATPSVTAAAWKVLDAWTAGRPLGEEMGALARALDPELRR